MKDRDFKMRERWHKKEQERFERIKEKAAKLAIKDKMERPKECDSDIYSEKDRECKESGKTVTRDCKKGVER